jgi:hypothetical protein
MNDTWLGSCVVDRYRRLTDCPVKLDGDPEHAKELYQTLERLIAMGRVRGRVGAYGFEVYEAADAHEPM